MRLCLLILCGTLTTSPLFGGEPSDDFRERVAPLLEARCLRCHSGAGPKGDVNLSTAESVLEGRGGSLVVPGKPDESYLIEVVSGEKPAMPKDGPPLSAGELAALRRWVAEGATWPDGLTLAHDPRDWWSLRPLVRPAVPVLSEPDRGWARNPIDAFVLAKLREQGLSPSREADRRTLIRRLSFDLLGLPPTPQEVSKFLSDSRPDAYERLVDRMLASPRYGERWARHWLDAARYADTHGYDKDKVRPNAWPYRDYVVRAFNEDKPYGRFAQEQLAGDRLYPGTPDGIVALGFLAAGPFDFVGQIEVAEGTTEKDRVRNIDRDEMVAATMNVFVSMTAQCARCHDHKFDPVTQEDYYSLQAVFAGVDRADRTYDADPSVAHERIALERRRDELIAREAVVERRIAESAGPEDTEIEKAIAERTRPDGERRPAYGYHSAIASSPDTTKWVQVDLGRPTHIALLAWFGCDDDFAGIGGGFGFPVRYKVGVSDDPEFRKGVTIVADRTEADAQNPGVAPQTAPVGATVRYIRVTATKLAERQDDYIFALAELAAFTPDGRNAASGATVTALDSIEAPVRWRKGNLVDGNAPGAGRENRLAELVQLCERRRAILARATNESLIGEQADIERAFNETSVAASRLPAPATVFAAATEFPTQGNFQSTGGIPRPVYLLGRGDERNRTREVKAGTVGCLEGLPARFELSEGHDESERRVALAEWIVSAGNPLTWRSIVNRVWQHHFGRGIVETPNDFGRMGSEPTHPELLDWLAVEVRDGGRSLKQLHRIVVTSATYRQASAHDEANAALDGGNRFLWRMNRRRLEAEAVRDAALFVSGDLDDRMYGPGFRAFGFLDDHSPHYSYEEYDPDDRSAHRRAIYRFVVRSVPDPFLETLDCADPSSSVARRNETLTPLQALALLNNPFMVRAAERFASRVEGEQTDTAARLTAAYRLAFGHDATADELSLLVALAERRGLANVCRLVFNANEFIFVD